MKLIAQAKDFWYKNRKVLTIVLASVLGALFIGSILLAVFIGGEFKHEEVAPVTVKGKISVAAGYDIKNSYGIGDNFEFDKDEAIVNLVAKYPEQTETVRRELDGSEYGFLINGEGELYTDADSIVLDENVKYISLVWSEYTYIKFDINITVTDGAE